MNINSKFLMIKDEDGLTCLEEGVHRYTLTRYKIYRIVFSRWTKWWTHKTSWIGYLDLTAGPGYSQTKELKQQKKQVAASPIIALNTEPGFTNFIFIERENKYCQCLEERLKIFKNCYIFKRDVNEIIDSVVWLIEGRCLVCVDPFRPSDIKWKTIKKVLQSDFFDLIGVLPAPFVQRPVGKFRDRLYIRSLYEHMPPSFSLEKVKRLKKGFLQYCMRVYRENIEKIFGRFVASRYIKPYQVIFTTKDYQLSKTIHQSLRTLLPTNFL